MSQYVGRIVAVGRNEAGGAAALYRVSSRSFPNRQAVEMQRGPAIIPREGFESDIFKNPYIAYNCLRSAGDWAIATNGTQTDPIAEKVAAGVPVREAMVEALLTLDYEKDDYNTPRIAAAIALGGESGYLGIVRHDALVVKEVAVAPGEALYIATYEADDVREGQRTAFDAADAAAAAKFAVDGGAFAELTNPVTSAAALEVDGAFTTATYVVPAE